MSLSLAATINVDAHPIQPDPAVHQTDSDDLIFWWSSVIGPTGVVLAHRLARYTAAYGATDWDLDELAQLCGVSRSRLIATLDRLHQYGVISFIDCTHVLIHLWLPALTDRRLTRLPAHVAADYRRRYGRSVA